MCGARPFGVSILFGGLKDGKTYVYMLDPSGTFFEYRAIAIGGNSDTINKTQQRRDLQVYKIIHGRQSNCQVRKERH